MSEPQKNVELMDELLAAIVGFIARSGMPLADIEAVYKRCVDASFNKQGEVRKNRKSVVQYGSDTIAGAVLRAWHRKPKYIDKYARPVPLAVSGKSPSLLALIRSQSKTEQPEKVLASMKSAGLIRLDGKGRFLPIKKFATIDSLHPLAVEHVAKTVLRLVETASGNMSRESGRISLIERYAHIHNLAGNEMHAFADFSREQGQACIDAVEDWLEARQVRSGGVIRAKAECASPVSAGVHIFAFLGEPRGKRRKKVPKLRRKELTPSPATPSAISSPR